MNAPLAFPTPARAFAAHLPPELRAKMEEAIERLLAILDAVDPDPEAEPRLGSNEDHAGWRATGDQRHWGNSGTEDREDEPEGPEPSLGWTASIIQAGRGWLGGLDDAEQEHDGREPSLGWLHDRQDQLHHCGGIDDREREDDNGIADAVV